MPKKQVAPDEDADKVQMLNNKVQTLQRQLVSEQEFSDRNRASENQIRQRVMYLSRDLKAQKQKMVTITTAMIHQYKQMQKEYNDELQKLDGTISLREDELSKRQQKLIIEKNNEIVSQIKKEQQQKLRNKEIEITELKKKIEDMSAQFAKMLKETLQKMQERINLAQWDNDNDPQMIKKMKQRIDGFN